MFVKNYHSFKTVISIRGYNQRWTLEKVVPTKHCYRVMQLFQNCIIYVPLTSSKCFYFRQCFFFLWNSQFQLTLPIIKKITCKSKVGITQRIWQILDHLLVQWLKLACVYCLTSKYLMHYWLKVLKLSSLFGQTACNSDLWTRYSVNLCMYNTKFMQR